MSWLPTTGAAITRFVRVAPRSRLTVDAGDVAPRGTPAAFSLVVDSSAEVAVDRLMTWDAGGYGSHAETGRPAPAARWYLAEGATHSSFDLFYLVQNPGATTARVEVVYRRPSPLAPVTRTYDVPPRARFNIWVNQEGPELAATDVSAVITSLGGQPIVVERAMYHSSPARLFDAGHESAGIVTPATTWFLAEGATGPYFDLFVLVANPGTTAAAIQARFLLPDGRVVTRSHMVAASSRFNIWVDFEDPALANTAVSTTVTSTNGVPIVVERAMWWPGPAATWHEAHNSAGATQAGTRWALGEGEVGGASDTETYVLVANTSTFAGQARVTLLFEDGALPVSRTYNLPPTSRTNVAVGMDFPAAAGRRFGVLVEGLGATPAQIVVEEAIYSDSGGVPWAAGANQLATRLP
jgi:hypothetical protein